MPTRDEELSQFKTGINLSELAAAWGFEIDPRGSSRNSVAMKHPDGEKIIIGMQGESWVYFAVHGGHSGTVIDFVQQRDGLNLGQVRQVLRPWLGGGVGVAAPKRPPASRYVKKLESVRVDHTAVLAEYEAAEPLGEHHRYLCEERALPPALLASDRFSGRIRVDRRGNALFPHWNQDKKLCGFEIKNAGFTGFAKHGTKGLWCSGSQDGDTRLVIAETAIDALSYAALFGCERTRFFSIAGQMNPHQPSLLHRAISIMPEGSRVVLAMDHDDGGAQLSETIRPIFDHIADKLGRGDLELIVDRPETAGEDWNDVLRADPARRDGARPSPEPGG